jgi:hypothetical protein
MRSLATIGHVGVRSLIVTLIAVGCLSRCIAQGPAVESSKDRLMRCLQTIEQGKPLNALDEQALITIAGSDPAEATANVARGLLAEQGIGIEAMITARAQAIIDKNPDQQKIAAKVQTIHKDTDDIQEASKTIALAYVMWHRVLDGFRTEIERAQAYLEKESKSDKSKRILKISLKTMEQNLNVPPKYREEPPNPDNFHLYVWNKGKPLSYPSIVRPVGSDQNDARISFVRQHSAAWKWMKEHLSFGPGGHTDPVKPEIERLRTDFRGKVDSSRQEEFDNALKEAQRLAP